MVGVSNSDEKCSQDNTHFENLTKNDSTTKNSLRKPRLRQVSSRYLSPSPSISSSTTTTTTTTSSSSCSSAHSVKKRYPSPLICHSSCNDSAPILGKATPGVGAVKRSQSADRRRVVSSSRVSTSGLELRQGNVGSHSNVGEVLGVSSSSGAAASAASKMLFTSTRSLSVSFQGEAFSLPISKAKVSNASVNASSVRKGTPERRRDTPLRGKIDVSGGVNNIENSKPVEQRRWPGKTREGNVLTKSFDCSADRKKIIGSDVLSSVRTSLQQSLLDESSKRSSFDGRLSFDLGDSAEILKHSLVDESRRESVDGRLSFDSDFLKADQHIPDGVLAMTPLVPFDLAASDDTDSVSSDSTSGKQEYGGRGGIISGRLSDSRGLISTRFWQETNSRLRRLQDPGSPLSASPRSSKFGSLKSLQPKRFSCDSPLSSSSPRTTPSPIRGATRPASPSRLLTPSVSSSPSRGNISPSRRSSSSDVVSILSFSADIRRGKIGENRVVDAHLLRLLYNRYLQWRFVNARAEASFLMQKRSAEKNQWNAWITISELRHSVTIKRSKLLLLKQKLKLSSILKGQMICLEEWALLDRGHSSAVLAATEALKASTLRLPIVGKAVADIQSIKDAMSSAVDVMQAMGSSILALLSKVEQVNTLLTELKNVTSKEQTSLDQCKNALCRTTAMQVKDCSLRTHLLQLNRVPDKGNLTTLV